MQTWAEVTSDDSVREALYLYSGLSYILQPSLKLVNDSYSVPLYYTGFQNGLYY